MAIVQYDTGKSVRDLFKALVDEVDLTLDGGCDHAVGICECSTRGLLHEAKLALDGKRVCNCCWGDGACTEKDPHGINTCIRCDGAGSIPFVAAQIGLRSMTIEFKPYGHDVTLVDEGSIILMRPESQAAKDWLDQHVGHTNGLQPYWPTAVVERRYAGDIVEGMLNDGLTVAPGR